MALKSDDLVSSAVDAIVQHGFLVKVNVSFQGEDNNPRSRSFMMAPNTTVADLKRLLAKEWSIPEEEQRLYHLCEGNNDNNKPLLGGTLEETNQTEVNVVLQRQALDPRLKSLFGMVGLEQWEERDRVMNMMTKVRIAKRCYNQHPLVELGSYKAFSRQKSYLCAKCHMDFVGTRWVSSVVMKPFVCEACCYCLCTRCFEADEGRTQDQEDPYEALQALALGLGRQMAAMGSYYGGRGHFCGHLPVRCRSEYAPQVFVDNGKGGLRMKPCDKILQDGIRLQIRFGDEARDFLVENGFESAMAELEINEVRDHGATIRDMMNLRGAWARKKEYGISDALYDEWSDRFPRYRTVDGERAKPYPTTKLTSYNLGEAVYEVGVRIDDGDY